MKKFFSVAKYLWAALFVLIAVTASAQKGESPSPHPSPSGWARECFDLRVLRAFVVKLLLCGATSWTTFEPRARRATPTP